MSCALCAVADCVVTWWSSYSARKMYIYFACKTIFFSTLHLSFDPFIINSELLRNDLNSISVRLVEMLGRRSTKREPDNQNEKLFPHRWFPNGETIRMSAQETKRFLLYVVCYLDLCLLRFSVCSCHCHYWILFIRPRV